MSVTEILWLLTIYFAARDGVLLYLLIGIGALLLICWVASYMPQIIAVVLRIVAVYAAVAAAVAVAGAFLLGVAWLEQAAQTML